jgi:cytochrome c
MGPWIGRCVPSTEFANRRVSQTDVRLYVDESFNRSFSDDLGERGSTRIGRAKYRLLECQGEEMTMSTGTKLGLFLVALALAACQQTKESPSEANPDATPRHDAGAETGSMSPKTLAPGMMGEGTMGSGMMGTLTPPEPGANGESIFRSQCAQCHLLTAGSSGRLGPSLHGLFGRKAGTALGYSYSTPMRDSGVVWNDTTLDQYIADPQSYIPGNTMPFPGIADKSGRQRLVAYLKEATR